MKIINAIIALVGIGLFVACDDDQKYGEGDTMTVTINASTELSGVEASRAVLGSEVNITNYVFMLYDGFDRTNSTLKYIYNITNLPKAYELTMEGSGPYFAVMIANTTKEVLVDQGITEGSLLENLFSATFDINTTDNNPTDATKFTWSGYLEVNPDTRNLHFSLNPNLAKITVSVTDKSSDNDVINIQVRNVPNKARFAQNALSKAGFFTTADNATSITDWIDYDIEELTLTKNTVKTMSWYLPHNEAGSGNRSSNPVNAPENATYVEVDALRTIDFLDTAYKIYPGTDEDGVSSYVNLKNFNVKADYQYKIIMSINDDGITYQTSGYNSNDHGGISVDRVILPEGSNCYMIHPKFSNSAGGTVYELPAWRRVNEYWGNSWGISGVGNSSNVITDDTEWEIVVLWQDIRGRAMYFCDINGNLTDDGTGNKSGNKFLGKGKTPFYFKLDQTKLLNTNVLTTDEADDIYGNILVALKTKSTNEILWSWHLWLTDYIPDGAPEYAFWNYSTYGLDKFYKENSSTYSIDVQNSAGYNSTTGTYSNLLTVGNVQHFWLFDGSWYNGTSCAYWTGSLSNDVWDQGGIYGNCWIMDRNIGAQGPSNSDTDNPVNAFGMYYQFGRKDPMPYQGSRCFTLYDITGANVVTLPSAIGGNVEMNEGVKNPMLMYTNANGRSWTKHYNGNPWYSPVSVGTGKKTIFDPCPPGWCLPKRDAYDFAIYDNGVYNTTADYTYNAIWYQTAGEAYIDVVSQGSKTVNDNLRHFALIRYHYDYDKYKANAVDFYMPIQGYLSYSTGKIVPPVQGDTRGYLWTCDNANVRGGATTGGVGLGFGVGGRIGVAITPVSGTRSGRYRYIYNRVCYYENFGSCWGLNARCIQEPH